MHSNRVVETSTDTTPLRTLVREALERVADPSLCNTIVEMALSKGNLSRVPEDEGELCVFVGGPLHATVLEIVGVEAATDMIGFLDPILSRWLTEGSSGIWRARKPSQIRIRKVAVVLIIEDDPLSRQQLEILLTSTGYQVLKASDGRVGLELCRKQAPDLVLVALPLKGTVDTERLVGFIKLALGEGAPPVLLLRAPGEEVSFQGAAGYVLKPINGRELLSKVEEQLADRLEAGEPSSST